MKTKALTLALAGLTLINPAQAENNRDYYVSGSIGASFTNDVDWSDSGLTGEFGFDNAANIAVAVGTQINPRTKAEIELSYRESDIDSFSMDGFIVTSPVSGEFKTTTVMVNGYYDLTEDTEVTPYLSAGLGLARHKGTLSVGSVEASDTDTVFAYQLGAGISKEINDKSDLTLGYRYLGSSDPEFDTLKSE